MSETIDLMKQEIIERSNSFEEKAKGTKESHILMCLTAYMH